MTLILSGGGMVLITLVVDHDPFRWGLQNTKPRLRPLHFSTCANDAQVFIFESFQELTMDICKYHLHVTTKSLRGCLLCRYTQRRNRFSSDLLQIMCNCIVEIILCMLKLENEELVQISVILMKWGQATSTNRPFFCSEKISGASKC